MIADVVVITAAQIDCTISNCGSPIRYALVVAAAVVVVAAVVHCWLLAAGCSAVTKEIPLSH